MRNRSMLLAALVAGIAGVAGIASTSDEIEFSAEPPPQSPTRRAEKIAAAETKRARKAARRLAKLEKQA